MPYTWLVALYLCQQNGCNGPTGIIGFGTRLEMLSFRKPLMAPLPNVDSTDTNESSSYASAAYSPVLASTASATWKDTVS